MTGLRIDILGFPRDGKDLERSVKNHITNNMNGGMGALIDVLRVQAPKDLGDHSQGYRLERFRFDSSDELAGALINEVPNSLYRERGRPPGKMPPISALEGWARRRGLSPYLVAKKIGDFGTDRWIENKNPLGIDRASQPGDIVVNNGSPVIEFLDLASDAANDFEF